MKNKTKTKEKKRRKREKNGRKEKASNGHLKISICLHQRITLFQQTHIHNCNSMKRTTWNRIEWVKTKSVRNTQSTTNMEAKRTRIVHGKPVFGQNARISLATFVRYQCILTFCTTGIRMNVWFTNRLVILKNKVALDHKNQDFIMPLSIVSVEREFHFNWTDAPVKQSIRLNLV